MPNGAEDDGLHERLLPGRPVGEDAPPADSQQPYPQHANDNQNATSGGGWGDDDFSSAASDHGDLSPEELKRRRQARGLGRMSIEPSVISDHDPDADDPHLTPGSARRHVRRFFPIFTAPLRRQWWMEDGSSSLSKGQSHRTATASDLCLDLVIIVCLASLGSALEEDFERASTESVASFLALFLPIFFQWLRISEFKNRFDAEDVVFGAMFLFNLVGFSFVAITVEPCYLHGHDCTNFSGSLAGLRGVLLLFLCYAFYYNANYAVFFMTEICVNIIICILLFVASQTVVDITSSALWWTTVVLDILCFTVPLLFPAWLIPPKYGRVPLNLDLMAERQGLFVIISLGEVITAALSFTGKGQVEQINNNRQSGSDIHKNLNYPYLPMLQTVLLAGAIKFMYFDLADVAQPSTARTDGAQHALARSTQSGVLWLVLHAPLNAAITITGSFLKSFVTEGTLYHWYVTVSMSVAIFCTIAMRLLCHGGNRTFFHRKLSKYYREFVWFAGAIILAVLPAMFGISECKASSRDCNAENFLGVYIVLLYGLLAVNIWARHPRNFRLFEDIVGWERRKDAHDHNVQHPSSVTLIRPATEPVERHSGPDDDSDYVLLLRGSEELPGGNTARQRTTALLNNLTPEVLK